MRGVFSCGSQPTPFLTRFVVFTAKAAAFFSTTEKELSHQPTLR